MDVRDADTAGAVWPRGADGHRSGGGRLHGALPQVRDHRSGAGDPHRSAASAVGAGAAYAKIATPAEVFAFYFPFHLGWLRWRSRPSWM